VGRYLYGLARVYALSQAYPFAHLLHLEVGLGAAGPTLFILILNTHWLLLGLRMVMAGEKPVV